MGNIGAMLDEMFGAVDKSVVPRNRTTLSPSQERDFQRWYRGFARFNGIDENPDNPEHRYDYRGAYAAGDRGAIDPSDGYLHLSSAFKDEDHPNRYVNGIDTFRQGSVRSLLDDAFGADGILPEPTPASAPHMARRGGGGSFLAPLAQTARTLADVATATRETPDRSVLGEFGAGVRRGTTGLIGDAGGLVRMAGGLVGSDALRDYGSILSAGSDIADAQAPPSPDSGITLRRVAGAVGEGVPQVAAAIGAGVATGGMGTAAALGAFAGTSAAPVVGSQYNDAMRFYRDAGVDLPEAENRASLEAATAGLVTGATSLLPGAALLRKAPGGEQALKIAARNVATRMLTAGAAESVQEMSEQVLTDAAAALIRDDPVRYNREYWESIGLAGIAGAVLGGAARGGVEIGSRASRPLSNELSAQPDPARPVEGPETVADEAGTADVREQPVPEPPTPPAPPETQTAPTARPDEPVGAGDLGFAEQQERVRQQIRDTVAEAPEGRAVSLVAERFGVTPEQAGEMIAASGAAKPQAPRVVEQPLPKKSVADALKGVAPELFERSGGEIATGIGSAAKARALDNETGIGSQATDHQRLLARVFAMDKEGRLHRDDIGKVVGLPSDRMQVGDEWKIDGETARVIDADESYVIVELTGQVGDLPIGGGEVMAVEGESRQYVIERGSAIPANQGSYSFNEGAQSAGMLGADPDASYVDASPSPAPGRPGEQGGLFGERYRRPAPGVGKQQELPGFREKPEAQSAPENDPDQTDLDYDSDTRGVDASPRPRPRSPLTDPGAMRAERDGRRLRDKDSPHRVIRDLASKLGIGQPGVGGRVLSRRKAEGYIQAFSEAVRIKRHDSVRVFAHEAGHFLHKALFPKTRELRDLKKGLSAKVFPAEWRPELIAAGRELYGARQPNSGYASEGWAEYIADFVTDPSKLTERFPKVHDAVMRRLATEAPEILDALTEARDRWEALRNSDDPIGQYIAESGQERPTLKNLLDDANTLIFDRFTRINTLTKDLGAQGLPAIGNPHIRALRVMGHASGDMKRVVEFGTFDPDNPAEITGPSISSILNPVRKKLPLFERYVAGQRALEKRAQGFDGVMAGIKSEAIKAEVDAIAAAHPEIVTAAEQFQTLNEWLIGEYAVQKGLLTPEAARLVIDRNQHYITFAPVKASDATRKGSGRGRAGAGFSGQTSGVRRFSAKQGEQIHPPLASFVLNMQGLMTRARLNEVGQKIVDLDKDFEGTGRWFEKIDRPQEGVKLRQLGDEALKSVGIKIGADGEPVIPKWMESLSEEEGLAVIEALASLGDRTFFRPSMKTDKAKRQVTILRDGKPEFYEIKDRRLFEAMEGLNNPVGITTVEKLLSLPGRFLRAGATQLNPSFFIPNFWRDFMQALTMTEGGMRSLPADSARRVRGMAAAWKDGRIKDLFLASGADLSGLFGEYVDPRTGKVKTKDLLGQRTVYKMARDRDVRGLTTDLLTLGPVSRLNQRIEMMNRVGEAEVVRRGRTDEGSLAQAGQAAADITLDFQRGGSLAVRINQIIPFFNASLQGTNKLARFIKRDPLKAGAHVMTYLMAPTIIAIALNLDDEEYWAIPQRMRDRHWYLPVGTGEDGKRLWLKIPKPYGLGVFPMLLERQIAALAGIDPQTGERGDPEAFKGAPGAVAADLLPPYSVAGLMPILEVSAGPQGYSYFFQRNIVSGADKDLPPEDQGAVQSSEFARTMGRLLEYPPAKIDYLVRGFLGGLGADMTQVAVDPLVRRLDPQARIPRPGGEPVAVEDYLVIRRFLASEPRSSHEALSRFYTESDEINRAYRGWKSREAQPEEQQAFYDEHADLLRLRPVYETARRRIAEQRSQIRALYRDRTVGGDELRRMLDERYAAMIDIAKAAAQWRAESGQ